MSKSYNFSSVVTYIFDKFFLFRLFLLSLKNKYAPIKLQHETKKNEEIKITINAPKDKFIEELIVELSILLFDLKFVLEEGQLVKYFVGKIDCCKEGK
jgi:hypothetical protein